MPRKRDIRANKLCPVGLCPILHYNLALVAHLLGIQKAEYGKSYLQEANRLYRIVSADIQSRPRCLADSNAVLLMGIWNNQGCIYIELGVEEYQATHIFPNMTLRLLCASPSEQIISVIMLENFNREREPRTSSAFIYDHNMVGHCEKEARRKDESKFIREFSCRSVEIWGNRTK
jgi:hypothetical protein